jgi:hypothetical protein
MQGLRLAATLPVLPRERQRIPCQGMRLLQATCKQMRLTQGETTECLIGYSSLGRGLPHGLCEQRQGVGDASSEVVCRTKATAISVRRRVVIRRQGIVKVTSLLAQLPSYVPYSPHEPRTHRRSPAPAYRQVMAQGFQMWRQVTGAAAA